MIDQNYRLPSRSGLCRSESVLIVQKYLDAKDWELVKTYVLEENVLQKNSRSTSTRAFAELLVRLRQLKEHELVWFVSENVKNQDCLLWIAVCRTYPFVAEFYQSVIANRLASDNRKLVKSDFDVFLLDQAKSHEKLLKASSNSIRIMRGVVFLLLRDLGVLTRDWELVPLVLSSNFIKQVSDNNSDDLSFLPVAGLV